MSKSTKSSEAAVIRLANKSTLSAEFELQLDMIKLSPEDYRHREEADLDAEKESMKVLKDSLRSEGLLEPLIVYRDIQAGAYVQITGHRRRAALEQLADANVEGFTRSMPVRVREIQGGTRDDFFLISALDNTIREQVTEFYKIHSTVRFIQAGVDHNRIKYAMGIPDTTFERCRRLAANPWMMAHIERNEISLTNAHLLLEAAGGKGGPAAVENLRKDFAIEVANVKAKIIIKEADLATRDKELSKADGMVKNYFAPHVNKAWVARLRRGEPIKGKVKYKYAAALEKTKAGKRVVIAAVNLLVVESNLDQLVEVAFQLDRLLKIFKPEVNALARQKASLLENGEDEDNLPSDYASAGLDAVADLYAPRATADDDDDGDGDATTTKAKVAELLAQLGPDDIDPLERESTQAEINRNYDQESARTVTPATAGLEVPAAQPPDTDAS